jgi:hypothetical protein
MMRFPLGGSLADGQSTSGRDRGNERDRWILAQLDELSVNFEEPTEADARALGRLTARERTALTIAATTRNLATAAAALAPMRKARPGPSRLVRPLGALRLQLIAERDPYLMARHIACQVPPHPLVLELVDLGRRVAPSALADALAHLPANRLASIHLAINGEPLPTIAERAGATERSMVHVLAHAKRLLLPLATTRR